MKHKNLRKPLLVFIVFAMTFFALWLTGCSSGGDSADNTTNSENTTTTTDQGTLSGSIVKGPVANAQVKAFAVKDDGTKGELMGSTQTDNNGNFSMSVSGNHAGSVLVEASGGHYTDEASGQDMNLDMMSAAIPFMSSNSDFSGVMVTPLTSMAQQMALTMTGSMTQSNITKSNNDVGQYFEVDDILYTHPMNPNMNGAAADADQNEMNYGMVMAAMSQYAELSGVNTSSFVNMMTDDASDGHINGKKGNSGITMGMGSGSMMGNNENTEMSSNAGTSGLAHAMQEFVDHSQMNNAGVSSEQMQSLINKLNNSNGKIE